MARTKKNDNMFGRVLAYGLITLVLVILVIMAQRKENIRAADVEIVITSLSSGDFLIKSEDVLSIIELAFGHQIVGVPLGELDMDRIERVLEGASFVLEADAYIDAEHLVHLDIAQREPIVRVIDRDGQQYYLDITGSKMQLSNHFTARVLVATGDIPPYDPDFPEAENNNLREVYELTKTVLEDELLSPLISQIHIGRNNELQMIPTLGNQRIILGNTKHLDDKINRLKVFYNEALSRMGWNKYKTINLKFRNQVVCKKR